MIQNKKIIAITGGIGAGKSTVCKYLQKKGYFYIDCDRISRDVATDSQVLAEVREVFGTKFVVNGTIQRRLLRDYVFGNKERLNSLNKIFVKRILDRLLYEINAIDAPVVFVEVTNYTPAVRKVFDAVWLISADESDRIARVVFRDNVSVDQVDRIISQQNLAEKPDEIIVNNDYVDKLYKKIDKLLSRI